MLFIPPCPENGAVKSVFYPLVCQVQEDTLLVLWQPVGDGVSFHTTLQRRFLFLLAKITTMKSVLKTALGEKHKRKESSLKAEKERRKYSRVLAMFTSPIKCPLTGGKA